MKMDFMFFGRLKKTSRYFIKGLNVNTFGIRDKMFYLLDGEKQQILSQGDIEEIFVIQGNKKKGLSVDEFLKQYKNVL